MPELKRVIAAYDDRVVMEEMIEAALAALFKEGVPPAVQLPNAPELVPPSTAGVRAREALSRYDRAMAWLKAGDWSGLART